MEVRASAIVKLGGSLLGLPDLGGRLTTYLADFSRPRPILICGGGPAVERLREWDRLYAIGETECHWIALRMLSVNTRIVSRIVPDLLVPVNAPEDCPPVWQRGKVPIYDSYHFIAEIDEASHDPLPRRWRVTSDSIAARMAVHFGAPELVLLKSRTLPPRISLTDAAAQGYVDPHFPSVARTISRIAACNLRRDGDEESVLVDDDDPLRDAPSLGIDDDTSETLDGAGSPVDEDPRPDAGG
jgi:aspartokinase-like uncharacterized kinase